MILDIYEGLSGGIGSKLKNYFKVSSNEKPSRMRVVMGIEADLNHDLMMEHEKKVSELSKLYEKVSWDDIKTTQNSLMDLKIQLLQEDFKNCSLCENRCEVDRNLFKGYCDVQKPLIASEFMHMNEEFVLVPSHTIFFRGCNFKCVYCQNWDISQNTSTGLDIAPEKLATIIDLRRKQGSRNVNFVGGDPTPNMAYIFEVMQKTRENIPVVWNSNLYSSKLSMDLLVGFVDLFLTDFKYGNNECAEKLSGIQNYFDVVGRNHKLAQKSADMIIRHLVLPNHIECCSKPILKWIADNLGLDVVLNIMSQYRPEYNASEHEDVAVLPTRDEIREVILYAEGLGFENMI